MPVGDSFGTRAKKSLAGQDVVIYSLRRLEEQGAQISRLPFSIRVLIENLLRNEDGAGVTRAHVEAALRWTPDAAFTDEIGFTPARVLLQDFTGVPCVVDLAAIRDAVAALGGDPERVNPLQAVELVIDHSVQIDAYGSDSALDENVRLEYQRNMERYSFLKWGSRAFRNFSVTPPGSGICHQVNIERLARVVFDAPEPNGERLLYPDTVVGTDSHTTMVNGLGVLGWGVGGIEAEAAMLGQPVSMVLPQVVGVRLTGTLPAGATATDLVLTLTQMLRAHGVVGRFVEYFGPGVRSLTLPDRATIANMAPEYGATCGIFAIDDETLRYLRVTGRPDSHVAKVEAYLREQGLFSLPDSPEAEYSQVLHLDLGAIEPSVAGPRRPQDRVLLSEAASSFAAAAPALRGAQPTGDTPDGVLADGSVVIAAITSCTNTSNPSVMMAAGLLARNAVRLGLAAKPWVKTSLAPGSRAVTNYLDSAGLTTYLDRLGFQTAGYGCTTCIGNSGPLADGVSEEVNRRALVVCSVLSGNRNFEGRIHQDVRANYLMSPPLVVAYAIAGSLAVDLSNQPLGVGSDGNDVYLRDIWPGSDEVSEYLNKHVRAEAFAVSPEETQGDWALVQAPEGPLFDWAPASTYIRRPTFFADMGREARGSVEDIAGARVLALLGDSVTTDHISPAGAIKPTSPAAIWLGDHGVGRADFNSYGSRRGNHEVMMRGTFANVRLRNALAGGAEGGVTRHLPEGALMSIWDAAAEYQSEGTPLVVLAGREYGSGSSRDWAAKGPFLQGVSAVIAQSYERIHRSNLVGMGIAPLEFQNGQSAQSLGLTGEEVIWISGIAARIAEGCTSGRNVQVRATAADGATREFTATLRIDTPREVDYYRHGGILQYVARKLLTEGGA